MTRHDLIIATIRTGVPSAIGWLLAQLIAAVPAVADVIAALDETLTKAGAAPVATLLNALGVALVIAGYYWSVRQFGIWFPKAKPWLERFLLGSASTPLYVDAFLEVPKPLRKN